MDYDRMGDQQIEGDIRMSLTTPLLFLFVFIIILSILSDAFSLLVFGILMVYVFLDYNIFFTDTMTATMQDRLQLITGVVAVACFVKMIYLTSKKRSSDFFSR